MKVTWRNSLKSAVVGGGEGELTEKEHGDWRQLDDAGDKLELGVAVSQYLVIHLTCPPVNIDASAQENGSGGKCFNFTCTVDH